VAKMTADPFAPIRVKPREAARMACVSVNYLRNKLMPQGIFTVLRPYGYGPGKPTYLLYEEVVAYALGGQQGVRDVQKRAKRKGGTS